MSVNEIIVQQAHLVQDYNADRTEYLWTTMLIIFVPLVPTLILLFWPFPKKWRDRRDAFSMRKSCRYHYERIVSCAR